MRWCIMVVNTSFSLCMETLCGRPRISSDRVEWDPRVDAFVEADAFCGHCGAVLGAPLSGALFGQACSASVKVS